jgi:hypothetical protein
MGGLDCHSCQILCSGARLWDEEHIVSLDEVVEAFEWHPSLFRCSSLRAVSFCRLNRAVKSVAVARKIVRSAGELAFIDRVPGFGTYILAKKV